ncbi:MAG: rRNA small subunit methyltransferase 1, partial [Clostridia bacterium]|nr:rRNA small subunit methyltransferase 1 [Clostridia bacterium]
MSGKLYVVGTPIGNLSDFSPRAIETLREVDFIAAEDTRVTIKLLNKFEINTPMISYHKFNTIDRGDEICERIENGENCAIVTDAGMPCISDPGEVLVRQCADRGITVCAVPGPTALASALAI